MNIGGGAGAVLGTTSGISNLASSLAARLGGSAGSYFDQLRPASFRGVPFVSLGGEGSFGRRNEVHEYPLRADPWVEDLGRGTRRFRVFGFLVGDDVIAQRDLMIAACEKEGAGALVHPTYGRRDVSLMDSRWIERWEKGRYFEVEFDFIEGGPRVFPASSVASGSLVESAASGLNVAAALNFARTALTTLAYGAAVLGEAVDTAVGWYTSAKNLVGDARNLFRLLTNLPGDFGRFAGSATVPTFSKYPSSSVDTSGATVASLTLAAAAARANLDAAAESLDAAAHGLDASSVDDFTTAVQGVTSAMLAATPDPADSMRLLTSLAGYSPSGVTTSSTIGTAMATMQSASADLFRRSTIAAVAVAASSYEPTSSDDAARVRGQVLALIDTEMSIAGDQNDDETYEALSSLRRAVVSDLNQRGAGLPAIRSFLFQASLPSLTLANRIYRDAARADELTAQADPIHPAFFPTSFKALAT
ncbi:DNA circularization N-terminal domain-containing protein [Caballeronia sp. LZ065]|uniref:DNA circularization protein n=1 Tax=Caballeronia sp. LZ065 TaxID=3038571 RepID=UPI002864E705|nr:DNA circularization N-terminal domain-containing protein [Caballeronia sp. LZ065]MDR5784062.1 DNA circularization N-terminal domain-containing protein [Caballeronia sp. LZ065]